MTKKFTDNQQQIEIGGNRLFNHYWVNNSNDIKYRFRIDSWELLYVTVIDRGENKLSKYNIDNQREPFYIYLSENGFLDGGAVLNGGKISFMANKNEPILELTLGEAVNDEDRVRLP